jgi:hypothetical protein
VLGLAFSLAATAQAQNMMQLTSQDYIDIQMLSARYAQVIEHCTNRGYDYAALYTPDGEFGRTDDWGVRPADISKGPDQLATAAGGGPNGCQANWMGDGLTHIIVDTVISPTPAGAHGKSILLILGLNHDPTRIQRLGGYEDSYVKTPAGWRFKSRWHVFPIKARAQPDSSAH